MESAARRVAAAEETTDSEEAVPIAVVAEGPIVDSGEAAGRMEGTVDIDLVMVHRTAKVDSLEVDMARPSSAAAGRRSLDRDIPEEDTLEEDTLHRDATSQNTL